MFHFLCTRAQVRVVLDAVVVQLLQQLILVKMVKKKPDSIGDPVPSTLVVMDFCLWEAVVSFVDPRTFLLVPGLELFNEFIAQLTD